MFLYSRISNMIKINNVQFATQKIEEENHLNQCKNVFNSPLLIWANRKYKNLRRIIGLMY